MPDTPQLSLFYGKLTVVSVFRSPTLHRPVALCLCSCGKRTTVRLSNLLSGNTKSCGCGMHEKRHNGRKTPTWWTWIAMRRRCSDPKHQDFKYYGGRGIRVCAEWDDPKSGFVRFLSDMGERPEDRTLDRKDVDGSYTKSNCRWATKIEQEFNKRRWTRVNALRRARQLELQSENAHWDAEEAAYLASATMTGECTPSPS